MRRHVVQLLGIGEVVAKTLRLFVVGLGPGAGQLAGALQNLAQPLPQFGPLAENLGQDVANAQQRVGRAGNAPVDLDELGRPGVEIGGQWRSRQDFLGQRLQPALAGQRGQRLLLGLERQVQIFQPLRALGGLDLGGQRLGQFALRFDGTQDRLLSFPQQTQFAQSLLDLPDLLFVQPARFVFAITRDERNGVASIQ